MAVRNFYVEAIIDGRATRLGGGPTAKDGEMVVHLYQRENGEITEAFTIICRENEGKLTSTVVCKADEAIEPIRFETDR